MKKHLVVLLVLLCLLLASIATASSNTAKLVKDYGVASTTTKKTQILDKICKEGDTASYIAFYQLLTEAPIEQLASFGTILGDSKRIDVLIHLGDYLEYVVEPFRQEAKLQIESGTSEEEVTANILMKIWPTLNAVDVRLSELKYKIATAARPNTDLLIKYLKKTFADDSQPDNAMEGAILGLVMLQEEGYVALLQSLKTEDDELVIMSLVPRFREWAIIPTLKMIEDPASTTLQRKAGPLFIYSFFVNEPAVDKIVEALKHGRYFPALINEESVSLADIIDSTEFFWGYYLSYQLVKNPQFIDYIGEKHLPDPNKQDQVIRLMMEIDQGKALRWFMTLDPNTISRLSLDEICQSLFVSDYMKDQSAVYEPDRYLLLTYLFEKAGSTVRDEMDLIYSISYVLPEHQSALIVSCFPTMTKNEQDTAIYLADKLDPSIRDQIYDKIRTYCNDELLATIEYYQQ